MIVWPVRMCYVHSELWCQLFRNVDHCNQETTGAIEAYHKVLKVSTNTLSFPQERFSTVAHAKSVKNFRIQYMTK